MALNMELPDRVLKLYEHCLWLHDRNPSGTWADNVPVMACKECHALVLSLDDHMEWHANQRVIHPRPVPAGLGPM